MTRLVDRSIPLAVAAAAVAIVYLLDRATGSAIGLSLLYLAPVVAIAWRQGRVPGLAVAAAAALAWLIAEWQDRPDGDPGATLWNAFTRVVIYAGTAWLVAQVRADQEQLVATNVRLGELLRAAESLARTDPLTGLANARAFRERLAEECARGQRGGGGFAVAYVDLDHFKRVNDTLGHEAGDTALVTVATAIREATRREDVCARLGGDEFCVLFVGAGREIAETAARRIVAHVHEVAARRYPGTGLGASAGVVVWTAGPCDPAGLLKAADAMLYAAKEHGRGRVEVDELRAPPAGMASPA